MYLLKFLSSGSGRTVMLKRNIVGSIIAKGISIVISLVLVPLTLGYVTPKIYGIWLTLSSIMHWLTFFDIGFTQGLKNKLAEALAVEDYQKGKSLVSTTYLMMFAIFVPLGLLLCACVPLLNWPELLNVDVSYHQEIQKTLYILIWAFCLQMIVNVLSAVIMAHQKVALSSFFLVIGNLMSLIVVYILTLHYESSLFLLAISVSYLPIAVLLVAGIFLYKGMLKKVRPSLSSFNKCYVNELFGLGYRFFLIQLQFIVLYQTTNFIISNISGPDDVTTYNIVYKYLNVAAMLFGIILAPLWPAFTDAYAKNDYSWMNGIYTKMTRVYFLITVTIVLFVVVSPFIYDFWIGDKVTIPLTMTFLVAIYMIINMWVGLQANIINGIGKLKVQILVTMLGLVLHIPLSYLFGHYVGCYGVLLSMILITLTYSVVMTLQTRKLLNQTATGIWKK